MILLFIGEQAELDSIELEDIINSLSNAGEIYQEKPGSYKKVCRITGFLSLFASFF